MHSLSLEFLQAWRAVRTKPGAALALITVIAVGVGLTSTMFALADPFLLRPLPYLNPERLMIIRVNADPAGTGRIDGPRLEDWRSRADLFEDLAAFGELETARVQAPAGAVELKLAPVSENFFQVLGVAPSLIEPWKHDKAVRPIAVLAGATRTRLDSATGLAGMMLEGQDGTSFLVDALLPPDFLFPVSRPSARPDALTPVVFGEVVTSNAGRTNYVTVIARAKPGVTADLVKASLSAGDAGHSVRVDVQELGDSLARPLRPLALGALAAGLLIMLACGANAANLLVARTGYRAREFGTRRALGASSLDILRLLIIEVVFIAACAVLGSQIFVSAALRLIIEVLPEQYSLLGAPAVTGRVIMVGCALGIVATFASALPSWALAAAAAARTTSLNRSMSGEARALRGLRFVMVAGQAAVAMVLLVEGALLLRSYSLLWSQDVGFSGDAGVISVSYPPSESSDRLRQTIEATVEKFHSVAGVRVAAAVVGPLLDDVSVVGGYATEISGRTILLLPKETTPDYFSALGARIVAGRGLQPTDHGWEAVVVDEAFVRRLWPGRSYGSVVGEMVSVRQSKGVGQIVGVVHDMYDRSLDRVPQGTMFRPLTQPRPSFGVNYVLRLDGRTENLDSSARRTVASVDSRAVVVDANVLDRRLAATVKTRSFATLISVLFALAGVCVSSSGLVGIVMFVVARRTREIAIRRAIGARPGHIIYVVIREAVMASAAGSLVGLLVGNWLSRFVSSQLYGVGVGDGGSLLVAALAMVILVALAAWLPARRALLIEPVRALRVE